MKTFISIIGAVFVLSILAIVMNTCGDTVKVVQEQYSPSAMLKKYEMFKDLSAAIDKKRADISVYESELTDMSVETADERTYYNQRKSEMLGLISMHNSLCEKYNSQMSKFNYRFTNKGDLPESNLEPLPREIKPYILNLPTKKKTK